MFIGILLDFQKMTENDDTNFLLSFGKGFNLGLTEYFG